MCFHPYIRFGKGIAILTGYFSKDYKSWWYPIIQYVVSITFAETYLGVENTSYSRLKSCEFVAF
jgi:hypothetical protein